MLMFKFDSYPDDPPRMVNESFVEPLQSAIIAVFDRPTIVELKIKYDDSETITVFRSQ